MSKIFERLAQLEAKTAKANQEAKQTLADQNIYKLEPVANLAELRHQPPPRRIFGNFWYEGEMCYLFAASNKGKSVLAVQIADAISRGIDCAGFTNEVGAKPVAYFDFELTDAQFISRYVSSTDRDNYYQFATNFLRASVKYPKTRSAKEAAQILLFALRQCVEASQAKIIIIDNLTRIAGDIADGAAAFEVVSYLDNLKKDGYSILILGHTKKGDFDKYGLSANDALGSSMINNFIDSSFSIGANAANPSARYLKQLKARNCSLSDDVYCFEMEKQNDNFLRFSYRGISSETEQIKCLSDDERSKLEDDVMTIYHSAPTTSLNSIAKQINITGIYKQKIFHTTVSRIIAKCLKQQEDEEAAEQAEGDVLPF